MTDTTLFYINGKWTPPATPNPHAVENPATEQVIARISLGSQVDVDRAVAAARAAFESFSQTTVAERIALLERIVAGYNRRYPNGRGCHGRRWARRSGWRAMRRCRMCAGISRAIEVLKNVRLREPVRHHARAPRARRRVRAHHAVELAREPDRLQGGRRRSPRAAPWC
jgi:aldehyde dehydrogenase (NAD+)